MIFEEITWKNLMSYGNTETRIPLNNNKLNLIVGKNGDGKSVITEALSYVLTGKPYRKIKKAQLINAINNKNLEIKLKAKSGNTIYEIIRGIKPDVFEIYKDGNLVDQDSHIKDYQEVIDRIIGMDEKTLKQSVLTSSRFYTPFLEMAAAEKRNFVENLLSIQVFSQMLDVLKKRTTTLKQKNRDLEKDLERYESNILYIKEMMEIDKENDISVMEKRVVEIEKEKDSLQKDLPCINEELEKISAKVNQIKEKYGQGLNKYQKIKYSLETKKEGLEETAIFFSENDICPTCSEKITPETKERHTKEVQEKISEIDLQLGRVEEKLSQIDQLKKKIEIGTQKINVLSKEQSTKSNEINILSKEILSLTKQIESVNNRDTEANKKIKMLEQEGEKTKQEIIDTEKKKSIHETAQEVISDKGIKRFILNKYVPVLNSLCNEFLELLDASYRIEFDEELNERVICRGYEKLGYGNFSAGEKQRLDLALLFSFLEIGRMRNTVPTNLLILDEVLDNSLDIEGIKGVFRILERFKRNGCTLYVISHREGIEQYFDNVLTVTKQTFSEIKEA